MALFPNIILDDYVQAGDKFRIDLSKSFVSKDESAATGLTVTPQADVSAIDIFDADQDNWYLDWQTDFEIDIDSDNNKINFNEGGSELTATLTTNTYTLADLLVEIKTQLESAGALTYTLTLDEDDKLIIAATDGFSLLPETGTDSETSILPIIGFSTDQDGGATYTGSRITYLSKKITAIISNSGGQESITKRVNILSEAGDALFSTDANLRSHEDNIYNYLPDGRNSFKYLHRRAQSLMLDWLSKNGHVDNYDAKLTKFAFVDLEEVRDWATFLALRLLFEDNSNSVDDIFARKAIEYKKLEADARNRSVLRIDVDGDGVTDTNEFIDTSSVNVVRR